VPTEPLILIPALNAEPKIAALVEQSIATGHAVVVVDDGSADATAALAESAGARVLSHPVNRGKGAALRTGFGWALANGYSAVITLDADGQHLPSEIPRFIEVWRDRGADLVLGSRRHLFSGMVMRRRMANRFSGWAISLAAGFRIDDPQSGFRLYGRRVLEEIPFAGDRFDAESEILVRAGRLRLRVLEIPIPLGFVDGVMTSHYRAIVDTLRIAWRVIRTAA
jgi:glycosyltransferase involved in cell wall biosynthesis